MNIEQEARAYLDSRDTAGRIFASKKKRALWEAKTFGVHRFVVMKRRGPDVVSRAPEYGDYWIAAPSGVFAYVKGQRI